MALGKATAWRLPVAPEFCALQFEPPSVVATTVAVPPLLPTAQQAVAFAQSTPLSCTAVPDDWVDQVEPPFAVTTIDPAAPTAQHLLASVHEMPFSVCVVLEFCDDHVVPP